MTLKVYATFCILIFGFQAVYAQYAREIVAEEVWSASRSNSQKSELLSRIVIWLDTANPLSSVLDYRIYSDRTEQMELMTYTFKVKNRKKRLLTKRFQLPLTSDLREIINEKLKDCESIDSISCAGLDGTEYVFEYQSGQSSSIQSYWCPKEQRHNNTEMDKIATHIEHLEKQIKIAERREDFAKTLRKGYYITDGPGMLFIPEKLCRQ